MAIPAECPNCNQTTSNNQNQPPQGQNSPPNLGVITGVLGGLALIAFIVLIIVPLVRRRKARKESDLESDAIRGRKPSLLSFISSGRRSSFPHHKNTNSGPDALPLLPPLSSFTWSDLQRSRNASVDSLNDGDGMEKVELYSFRTDNATLSHQGEGGWTQAGRSVKTGERPAHSAWSGQVSVVSASDRPSPQRSPAPPGVPPSATDRNKSAQVAPSTSAKPNPSSAFSPRPFLPYREVSAPELSVLGIELSMEHPVKANRNTRASRPASLQLPSPPASPPSVPHSSQSSSLSRSRSVRSHSNATLPQSDTRFDRLLRPSLPSNRSAPTALPFRPPTSTSSSQLPWSPSPAGPTTFAQSSTQSPPLTGAFRNDLLRSGSSSSGAGSDSPSHYPVVTSRDGALPSSISRRRSSSTVSEMPPPRPSLESRLKPSDMFRRASLATNSPVLPGQRPVTSSGSSVMSLPIGDNHSMYEASASQPHFRMSESHHTTPQYETVSSSHGEQSASLSYFDSSSTQPGHSSTAVTSSSRSSLLPLPRERATHSIRPLPTPPGPPPSSSSSSSTAHHTSSRDSTQTRTRAMSKSNQPAYVRKKDSPALRPLPASPFTVSPPTSPPLRPLPGSRSRGGSISSLNALNPHPYTNRSRAGSVITLGETPFETVREGRESEEGSEDADSRKSVRAVLPPLQPLPPIQFDQYTRGK